MKDTYLTLIVPIKVKTGCFDIVKAKLIDLACQSRLESGNIFYALHESTSQPNLFIIYERWADQEALDAHMSQKYLRAFLEDSQKWLADEIAGIFCREV